MISFQQCLLILVLFQPSKLKKGVNYVQSKYFIIFILQKLNKLFHGKERFIERIARLDPKSGAVMMPVRCNYTKKVSLKAISHRTR